MKNLDFMYDWLDVVALASGACLCTMIIYSVSLL
ncbi:hypothetical protein LYSBPC_25530 [Lysinibacillus piscis]|uniref:Uncharacterized protein n=1 Tax=Lysinibacillus piscis TaxID=2518931 RepID=A0ABQ5NM49_9BACI|nr:hypothetical protein LYSBPC_25530 [Lysinibacillus sp. KH24]